MSYADSQPVFKDRATAAGLSEAIIQNLTDEKFDPLSKFAFAGGYVPGSGDDSEFVKTVKAVVKRDPSLGELASFRKLLHEAYSLVTQEMKQQLERSENSHARKLTQPERADLYERQVKRITGLTLKGPLEPSDSLVDVFCSIYESNRLRFVPWEKYTAKESELDKETKTEHLFALDSTGKLKVESKKSDPVADTSTEILLQYALQRRGLSMDQANLLDIKIHQLWVDRLIKVRLQVPPPGYSKTSFRQLLEADKKLFEELADETRQGIQSMQKLPEEASRVDPSEPHFVASLCKESHEGDTEVVGEPLNVASPVRAGDSKDVADANPEVEIADSPPEVLRELPLFIEACCGSAMLSACVAKVGFETLANDFHGNKHRPCVHVVELDLRKKSTWDFLERLVATERPFHFHAAQPCGTASRARDMPLSAAQHGPPPLRSEEHPLGLPWITGVWRDKLESANAIYLLLAAFCFWLNSLDIGWSIENPGHSYLWSIEDYKFLMAVAFFILYHSCVHGSERKKLTGILTNRKQFDVLAGYCQDDHAHLPWTRTAEDGKVIFDTSKEAAYPKLFCYRFASVLADLAGLSVTTLNPSINSKEPSIDARVATQKQPRGRKLPPLVAEFDSVRTVRTLTTDEPQLSDKRTLVAPYHGIPPGSKLLRVAIAKRGQSGDDEIQMLRIFGIYRSMSSFADIARSVMHPFDSFRAVPDFMLRVVCRILSRAPIETMKARLAKLKLWRQWADTLSSCNDDIFATMDSGCARVLKGKHLALLEKLATEIDWPDKSIHTEIRSGFKLVGMQSPSGIFMPDIKPRTLSEEDLTKQLRFLKPALWGKVQSSPPADYDNEIWDITMQEMRDKGWLEGPYSKKELDVLFQEQWLPVRRFAVWQRSKWRAIDDFSECGVNSTFSYLERIDLKALDEIIWIACGFVKFCMFEEHFDFSLSTGERLCGSVDPEWRKLTGDSIQLVAKTIDLKAAYKQFPIFPEHRRFSVLVLKRPTDRAAVGFVSKTLPFGSVASVLHFNRVARLLHRLGLQLDIPWTNYYDDYPVVDFKILSEHTTAAVRALTSLLGFELSLDKELPFEKSAEMLGVVLDLSESTAGIVKVANKLSRVQELSSVMQDILKAGRVDVKSLPSLFGRALFVESQFMGRFGKLALAELRLLEKSNKAFVSLSDVQVQAMANLLDRYQNAMPRTLQVERSSLPCVIFTDGACETSGDDVVCTIGGVLFDPSCANGVQAFGTYVCEETVGAWKLAGKKHPVAQTELYAECVARFVWKDHIDSRKCLFFIDNQGDLDALIKGYSSEDSMKRLLVMLEKLDGQKPCLPWYCRVPSQSNIRDLPSRGTWKELFELLPHCVVVDPLCPFSSRKLQRLPQDLSDGC
eukprot:s4340_g3.t1